MPVIFVSLKVLIIFSYPPKTKNIAGLNIMDKLNNNNADNADENYHQNSYKNQKDVILSLINKIEHLNNDNPLVPSSNTTGFGSSEINCILPQSTFC